MIKMTIGGEEVVCNKEFTIKEEMLSTSSTILNNCYPKSWEQDHDYTSRFYYPKDYSKCLIYNSKEPQTITQSGTALTFDDLINPTLQDLQIKGNTYQANSILPSGYTQVDYIQSSGTQYIDTGFKATPKTKIEATVQFTQVTPAQQRVFGNSYRETDGLVFTTYISGNGYFAWACQNNTGNWTSTGITADTNKHTFTMDSLNNLFSLDNYNATITSERTNNSVNTMLLLSYRNSAGVPIAFPYLKFYSTKIYDNNVLVRDFIPCYRNSDNVVGLYDLVNNVFYTNQGTGVFTYGSVVNIPNPDYPQNIETITGEQNIQIINSNGAINYPLSLGSIELCKIGDYQDYIYKDNGNWYLHKEINKYIFQNDNIDTYSFVSDSSTTNLLAVNINPNGITNIAYKIVASGYWIYCDNFPYIHSTITNQEHIYISSSVNISGNEYYGNIRLYINHNRLAGYSSSLTNNQKVDLVKTWLENNPTTIYYVTRYPEEDTQITNTTLISQLEAISIAKGNSYVTTENNTLPFDISMEVYDSGVDLLFSGMVKNTGNISLNPREPKYCSLEILDFKDFLSTGEYLDFVISNKTVLEAIQMVVDAVSQYGFVLGNVNILGGNDIIGAYSTQEKSAYDVFQYLADITGSRWTTRMIDENTVAIDFYDPTLMPQGQDIEYTSEWWCQNKVNDLTFNYGSRDYRNKQVMLSNQVYGGTNYTEQIIADGYNKNFITTENIGNIISILVNGNEATFSSNVDKEMGIDTDFYYTPGNNSIEGDNSYTAGTQITVTYTPLIKGREVIYNTNEVQRINSQIERKGVVSRCEQRNDILYTEDLEKIGQTYIKYKGSAEVILTLTTQVDIYKVGEVVYFNAPISDLAQNYMVKNKQTQIISTGDYSNIWYTYELTSSFNSENAINWFDNQRNKVNGNISEGEYITRNIDIENTANIIWDNLTITEVTPVGDNVLNSSLNSPLIQ